MSGDWDRIKEVAADALELEGAARREFVERACDGDECLRRGVERILDADTSSFTLLDTPVAVDGIVGDEGEGLVGASVGPYRIVRLLGEGGMGAVYEAEQDHPRRRVAVKLLRSMTGSRELEGRFRREIDALARLSHPAIARIHDADIAEIRGVRAPFFAMELIRGEALSRHAVSRRLDRDARVRLVVAIADGVDHAHRAGIVHRDLKPANVLVDEDGRPRILDFGIARTLAAGREDSIETRTGQLLGTMAYMSPEQASGDPSRVDRRTDVYALGVILYELLTGRLPVDVSSTSIPEACLRITHDEPLAPRTIDRGLPADLDTIVRKALAKEPERRYASARAFADDLGRYLAHEPIEARPASVVYHAIKFARRHRGLTLGTVGAIAALVVGLAIAWIARVRAEHALRAAEARAEFLHGLFAAVDPEVVGRDVLVADILDAGAEDVDRRFADEPRLRASLHDMIGWSAYRIGRYDLGRTSLRRALDLYRELDGPAGASSIAVASELIQVLQDRGDADESDALLREVLPHVARRSRDDSVRFQLELSRAWSLRSRSKLDEARAAYEDLVANLGGTLPDHQRWAALNQYALFLIEAGEARRALELQRRVYEESKAKGRADSGTLLALANFAGALGESGDWDDSVEILERVVPEAEATWGPEHQWTLQAIGSLAISLDNAGRRDEARVLAVRAAAGFDTTLGPEHDLSINAHNTLVTFYLESGDLEAAERECRALEPIVARRYGRDSLECLRFTNQYASLLAKKGDREAAEPIARDLLDRYEAKLAEGHPEVLGVRNNYGRLLLDLGRVAESVTMLRRNVVIAERDQPDSPYTPLYFRLNLARALSAAGIRDEAEKEFAAALEGARALLSTDHPHRRKILLAIAEAYEDWGEPERAATYRGELSGALDPPPTGADAGSGR